MERIVLANCVNSSVSKISILQFVGYNRRFFSHLNLAVLLSTASASLKDLHFLIYSLCDVMCHSFLHARKVNFSRFDFLIFSFHSVLEKRRLRRSRIRCVTAVFPKLERKRFASFQGFKVLFNALCPAGL